MASQYYYGTGRRKSSVARVRLYPGEGGLVVNGKPGDEYFSRDGDVTVALEALRLVGAEERFQVSAVVAGGGVTGQSEAVRHGVARALLEANPDLRTVLKQAGFLTRDPRAKERKKPGLKRARKAPQYTKR